jgi:hypothetical protein
VTGCSLNIRPHARSTDGSLPIAIWIGMGQTPPLATQPQSCSKPRRIRSRPIPGRPVLNGRGDCQKAYCQQSRRLHDAAAIRS